MYIYWLYTPNAGMQSFYSFQAALKTAANKVSAGAVQAFKITRQLNNREITVHTSEGWCEW